MTTGYLKSSGSSRDRIRLPVGVGVDEGELPEDRHQILLGAREIVVPGVVRSRAGRTSPRSPAQADEREAAVVGAIGPSPAFGIRLLDSGASRVGKHGSRAGQRRDPQPSEPSMHGRLPHHDAIVFARTVACWEFARRTAARSESSQCQVGTAVPQQAERAGRFRGTLP